MREIAIEWNDGRNSASTVPWPSGTVEVVDGELGELSIVKGTGTISGGRFDFEAGGSCRLLVSIRKCNLKHGSGATIITVRTPHAPFSFFLRDVSKQYPIFLPDHGMI